MRIALLNHGCAKNLVDAELMLGLLAEKGHEIITDHNKADVIVVNTCSFIRDAEKESVQSILGVVNSGKKVIVTGCLAQKYKDELKQAIPEIDALIGTSDLQNIVNAVEGTGGAVSEKPDYIYPETVERRQITVGASSYIKIADGCNYNCGYCIIPKLRGKYRSRLVENIVAEARALASKGVAEIVLVAQDTTGYGRDLYGKLELPRLLRELNTIEELSWIRVMYAYPSTLTDELLDTIAVLDKAVKYIDLPLQHSHPDVLRAMQRPVLDYAALIEKIRTKIPGAALRTAFITGYPGENEEQFNDLCEFVKAMQFEKMGVFEYSREKNTYSCGLKPQVPAKVKKRRRQVLMELQQGISREINAGYIGKTLHCIVEGFTDDGLVILRTQYDAPEIDGLVYAHSSRSVVPGDIEDILIGSAAEYDLYGRLVD